MQYRKAVSKFRPLEPVGVHFAPMTCFITDTRGKPRVDYILRQEQLDEDYTQFCKTMGWVPDAAQVFHCAKSRPAATYCYLSHYDHEMIEIINELYADDFLHFGYTPIIL
jgi:hypothetical protein